jgi:hypothetical protein
MGDASSRLTLSRSRARLPSRQFVTAINGGAIQTIGTERSQGAATGSRYGASSTNGVVNTFGGGASYFPGNAVGATSHGRAVRMTSLILDGLAGPA